MALRPALPSGTVTFAFTDIEGSTTRWERDRAAMDEAVRRHDAIVRRSIEQCNGHVFKTMGDAFFSVFERPEDAVAAMLAAQRALIDEDFSAVEGLRARAAIHAGTADQRERDYFGPAANKVARLLAIGHGGQVLLTAETAMLVKAALPKDASLRELGAYHLKDFVEPQLIFQLLAPGLPSEFPPLRSLGTLPSNLSVVDPTAFYAVPGFSGRHEELAAVQTALKPEGAVAVVRGLGGVGKSSVAREYGWRNREAYSVIWWLNAQTEDGVISGLVSLGEMFVRGLDQLDDQRASAKRVVNSILGGFDKPVLLVFDNLEDERLLRTWLPRTARALATSRNTAWATDVTTIPLKAWELSTAVDYLRRESGRPDLSEVDASAIAQSLGALPLALAHAAATLRNLRMVGPQRYLQRITEHLKNAPRGAEYPSAVFATFSAAIAQAEQQAPGAAAVLCLAALFAPDAIPEELFRQKIETYAEELRPKLSDGVALDLRSAVADEFRLDEALGALDRLSLLAYEQSSRSYSMHRLLQLTARDLTAEATRAWRESAVAAADLAFPTSVEFQDWPRCERLLPHARAALGLLPTDSEFLLAGHLAHLCAVYLMERGRLDEAEPLHLRALALREKVLGPDHLDVARSLHSLGVVYRHRGRLAEAEPCYTRALAIREGLGADHADVAGALTNLGALYEEQQRYAEAETVQMRALAIWERALGAEHPQVAYSLHNLATLYDHQGRYGEAERVYARTLAIREKALGADHPRVAITLCGLAYMYALQGRFAEAEPRHLRALAIREAALGPDHPHVADSLFCLAVMYRGQGRLDEAEPLLTRALAIQERVLNPDHSWTKATREALDALHSSRYQA